MFDPATLINQTLEYLRQDCPCPIYTAFPEEDFTPFGTAVLTIPDWSQTNPGLDDYTANIQLEIYTDLQADRDGRFIDALQVCFASKLQQITPQSESFPDIVGVLPMTGKQEDSDPLRCRTLILPVVLSF